MKFLIIKKKPIWLISLLLVVVSCKTNKQWEGQGEIKKVSTTSVPVQRQYKGTFSLGNGIYAGNDFEGGRLNGIILTNENKVTTLITPENTPINTSPWYAFKIWSDDTKEVNLNITYPEGVKHRYYPKKSKNQKDWINIDSTQFSIVPKISGNEEMGINASLHLSVSSDTIWISAQELLTTTDDKAWIDSLSRKPFVKTSEAGYSREGRPLNVLKIGESDDKAIIVVLSRQHPPEVTGYLAMRAFVETISSDREIAKMFRKKYNTYVFPLVNPDGVDNGHWRHNMGGVDLNRDWSDFNQPETSIIRDFFKEKVKDSGGKIYFFVDFHSTWEDIYYTIDPHQQGNWPGLVPELIELTGKEFLNYTPNVRPSPGTGKRVTSTSYFFYKYGAEALTYEIGDNTPREFVKKKGEVTANKLMELLLK